MLSPAAPPWERVSGCLISPSAITARCSSTAANKPRPSSRLLPVGGDTFDPEAGLMCPPTPQWVPAPASKSHPWLLISLCGAASHLQRASGLGSALAAPGPGPALGTAGRAVPSCKGRLALLGMLWGGEERSPPQPSKHPPVWKPKSAPVSLELGFCSRTAVPSPKTRFSCDKFLTLPLHVLS